MSSISTNTREEGEQRGRLAGLMKLGAEIVGGGITGAAAGFLIGGPAGSVVGGALGPVVKRGVLEVVERTLSRREQIRVSAAAQFALERYQALRAAGQEPRRDLPAPGDTAREELLEGILQKARSSYQEKKVRLLANIFADFAFTPNVSVEDAHAILSLVESLTYRQLVILEVFRRSPEGSLRVEDYRGKSPGSLTHLSILEDAYQLSLRGLVVNTPPGATGSNYMLGWHDVTPGHMKLTPMGKLLSALAGTDVIPDDDLAGIREAMHG